MQLIPETAQRFGVKNTFDPAQNVRGGIAYLRWLLAYFEGDVHWSPRPTTPANGRSSATSACRLLGDPRLRATHPCGGSSGHAGL